MAVIQSDEFNRSRLRTVLVASITSNLALGLAPGNVTLPRRGTGLNKPSVVNVSQLITLDREYLTERVGRMAPAQVGELDDGLRLVLGLSAK